jgi:uncharacterized protein
VTSLPNLGHLTTTSNIRVPEGIAPSAYIPQGKHIVLGQRRNRGSTDSLVLLGKCLEHTGVRDLFDSNVWFDVNFPHVVFICGKRGSGKSYDLGVLVEGLAFTQESSTVSTKHDPVTTIVFDTQSQFWTLVLPPSDGMPEDTRQLEALKQWRLSPAGLPDVTIFIPHGDEHVLGDEREFVISTAEMDPDDWCGLLQVDRYSPMGQCLRTVYKKVTDWGYSRRIGDADAHQEEAVAPKDQYSIHDMIDCLRHDPDLNDQTQKNTRDAVMWRLEGLADSTLFDVSGLDVRELLRPGQTSVVLLRNLDNATKALVVGTVAKKIFGIMGDYHTKRKVISRRGSTEKMDEDLPSTVWVVIDEAHVVCPAGETTAAKGILTEYVKRGRDAGLSLVLATQQPAAIDSAVLSQIDLAIVHRLAYDSDISAAMARFPARVSRSIKFGERELSDPGTLIRSLDDGVALVGDAESDRAFVVAIRPRLSAHGGGEPALVASDDEPS